MITKNQILFVVFCLAYVTQAEAGNLPPGKRLVETQIVDKVVEKVSAKVVEKTEAPIVPKEAESFSSIGPSTVSANSLQKKDVSVTKGEPVVCINEGRLSVRNENLNEVLFYAERLSPVKVFQGWGNNKKQETVNGRAYSFVRVQLPNHEDNIENEGIGWVAEAYVKPMSDCLKVVAPLPKPIEVEANVAPPITGFDDQNCCTFPIPNHPTTSFTTGQRQFGAGRAKGRLHAACDLYNSKNEPIIAVAPGEVIRNLYYFYQGTYALEVKHAGGFIVRYGEITGKKAKEISEGGKVKQGQIVGYMGKVNSKCCEPMLHFELYTGKKTGSLSQRGKGNKYHRRSDLVDPTKYLLRWEQESLK